MCSFSTVFQLFKSHREHGTRGHEGDISGVNHGSSESASASDLRNASPIVKASSNWSAASGHLCSETSQVLQWSRSLVQLVSRGTLQLDVQLQSGCRELLFGNQPGKGKLQCLLCGVTNFLARTGPFPLSRTRRATLLRKPIASARVWGTHRRCRGGFCCRSC